MPQLVRKKHGDSVRHACYPCGSGRDGGHNDIVYRRGSHDRFLIQGHAGRGA